MRKHVVLVSHKGEQYRLVDGPEQGVKLRLGQSMPHVKGTPAKRLVPLPMQIPYPRHGGVYEMAVSSTGEVTYRWKRSTTATPPL